MAHTVDSQAETPANDLRRLLDQAERELPVLERSGMEAYLLRLDQITAMLDTLAAEGLDLRAERSRWDDLLARIHTRASNIVRIAGGQRALAALRSHHPDAEGFWWRLDEQVAAQRQRSLTRLAIGALVAVILLAGASWIYQRFFAPSPATILLMDTLNSVERAVAEQDWVTARAAVDAALPTLPAEVELMIWGAVLAERAGDQAAAAMFLTRARAIDTEPARLAVLLGMKRLQAGDVAGAAAAATEARQLDPNLPEAAYVLASAAEADGDVVQALALYEEAARLSDDNNPQLAVTSRMRLGMLLQQAPSMMQPEATESAP